MAQFGRYIMRAAIFSYVPLLLLALTCRRSGLFLALMTAIDAFQIAVQWIQGNLQALTFYAGFVLLPFTFSVVVMWLFGFVLTAVRQPLLLTRALFADDVQSARTAVDEMVAGENFKVL